MTGICKPLRIGQTCDRAGTTERLNGRWWPPAARPRPLVSDWWAKLDLPSEQQEVWGWGIENILSEWWLFQARETRETRETRPASHTLSVVSKRGGSGMPDMSPMRQADFAGQAEPAGCHRSVTLPDGEVVFTKRQWQRELSVYEHMLIRTVVWTVDAIKALDFSSTL